jgi:hypothetical protein
MGSSEVRATPSAAPPQPCPGKTPAGQDPESRLSRSKFLQQRSDRTQKPVNSEQDCCSNQPNFNDCGRALSNSHASDLLSRSGSIFLVGTARRDFHRIVPNGQIEFTVRRLSTAD